jgi:hypothetical protein
MSIRLAIATSALAVALTSPVFAQSTPRQAETAKPIPFTSFVHDAGQARVGPGGTQVPSRPTDPNLITFARRVTNDFSEREPATLLSARTQTAFGEAFITVLWQASLCEQDDDALICPGLVSIGPRNLYQGPMCTDGNATFMYPDGRQIRSCGKTLRLAP